MLSEQKRSHNLGGTWSNVTSEYLQEARTFIGITAVFWLWTNVNSFFFLKKMTASRDGPVPPLAGRGARGWRSKPALGYISPESVTLPLQRLLLCFSKVTGTFVSLGGI